MIDSNQLLYIGKISGTFGIKGSVKVIPLTDFPERFRVTEYVYLVDGKKGELIKNKFTDSLEFRIKDSVVSGGIVKLAFDNFDGIGDAEKLKGLLVGVEEKNRVELPEGMFYFYEMIGCKVYDKGVYAGEVSSVDNYGSSDLLVVKNGKKSFFIPLLKEFVKKIDVDAKRIDAELIEGFFDEDKV
ncbi:MAG: ribosome maturation factor RimM [Bacteroidetes bacterium]|nr:ribosome maturation factor RimM [Bacteroidota bacterium]